MKPKRHHFLPQFYLKYFSVLNPKNNVWTYDMLGGKAYEASVPNTALEKHLYSHRKEDGTKGTEMEEMLSEIEGRAATHYKKLLAGNNLEGQDRGDIASFIAIMHVRTNSFRQNYAEIMSGGMQLLQHLTADNDVAFETFIRKLEKEKGPVDEEEKKKIREMMHDPSDYIIGYPKQNTLQAMSFHDELAPILFEMKWSILVAPKNGYFITSDNPVVKNLPKQFQSFYRGSGFIDNKIKVTFPLSPTKCWLGHWSDDFPSVIQLTPEYLKNMNRLRAIYAEKYFYAHNYDSGLLLLAKKYKETSVKLKISGPGSDKRSNVFLDRS